MLLPGTLVPASSYDGAARLLQAAPGGLDLAPFEWMREVENPTLPRVAAAVARLVEDRGNGPAVVVGHSTGAAIAAQAAADHPSAVAGLVLMDSGPNMAGHSSIEAMLAGLRAAATAESEDQWRAYARLNVSSGGPGEREEWIRSMVAFSRAVGAAPAVAVLESQHATDFLLPPLAGRCRDWSSAATDGGQVRPSDVRPAEARPAEARPVEARPAEVRPVEARPVEVLHGELDPKRGPGDAHAWTRAFPTARVRLLPGCGHTPPLETPEAVAEAVRRVATALRAAAA